MNGFSLGNFLRGSRRDVRLQAIIGSVCVIGAVGLFMKHFPGHGVVAGSLMPGVAPVPSQLPDAIAERRDVEVPIPAEEQLPEHLPNADAAKRHLREAGALIKARQYDAAIERLNDSRQDLKDVPQAYVVLGRALEGKREYAAARDFYNAAIDRDPTLADAYWGFATSSEGLNDLVSALGAMRSYLHTERDADPNRLRIAQARSAIWEWESKLGRGAWGATKGVPPGFAEAELRRDGRGVAVRMPVEGSENSDGIARYEIKSANKQKIFPR